MTFKQIVLRLARNPGYPDGDTDRGYVINAPLKSDGTLDLDAWRANRKAATVLRFDPDPAERADGWLTHRGSRWHVHYDEVEEGPDEPAYRLGDHKFVVGEYVTISQHGGDSLTYKVTEIRSV